MFLNEETTPGNDKQFSERDLVLISMSQGTVIPVLKLIVKNSKRR
jgi:hypothetical protein